MKRRSFLASAIASLVAACTRSTSGTDTTVQPLPASTATTPAASSTTGLPSSTPSTTTTTELPSATSPTPVEPIEVPPFDAPQTVFDLGVASGDPDAESVVLWTRLDGVADAAPVVWELSDDPEFGRLLATGLTEVDASTGHALHALATDLAPASHYWYRFHVGSRTSPAGRTKTLPDPSSTATLQLGISSCQAREDGAYAAHADMAAADLDLVVWLGDYIYGQYRTLSDYRAAYATYRRDPQLQSCHAAHPWILIPDDHEVRNDYDASVDPELRAAAYRAWWENQPTRIPPPTETQPELTFHRAVDIGAQARLILTDSRQYATSATLFGPEQLAFLEAELQHDRRWTVVASSVLASGLVNSGDDVLLPYTLDAHPSERRLLAGWMEEAPRSLIVSGDLHTAMLADFSADPSDSSSQVVATEIMAPAVSSAFPADLAPLAPFLPLVNRHVKHIDTRNGWLSLTIDSDQATAEFRTVTDVRNPESPIESLAFDIPH